MNLIFVLKDAGETAYLILFYVFVGIILIFTGMILSAFMKIFNN
jgi:hypothetical protein